jgi:hypothetical protein
LFSFVALTTEIQVKHSIDAREYLADPERSMERRTLRAKKKGKVKGSRRGVSGGVKRSILQPIVR